MLINKSLQWLSPFPSVKEQPTTPIGVRNQVNHISTRIFTDSFYVKDIQQAIHHLSFIHNYSKKNHSFIRMTILIKINFGTAVRSPATIDKPHVSKSGERMKF